MKTKEFIKQHSILTYCLMTFISSWGLVIFLAGPENIPIDISKSQDLLPLLYMSMLFGPSLSGILLIMIIDGKMGIRNLIKNY